MKPQRGIPAAGSLGAAAEAAAVLLALIAVGAAGACTYVRNVPLTDPTESTIYATTAVPTTSSAERGPLTPYTVVRGDTLIRIAERHGIHLNDLVRTNNIADPTKIFVGQILLIPPPPDPDDVPALTIAPATDPALPPLLPTTSAPPLTAPSPG